MSFPLSNQPPKRIAIRYEMKPWGRFSVMVVKTNDGTYVVWGPIPDIIMNDDIIANLITKRTTVWVDFNGTIAPMECVPKRDFQNATLISERYPEFNSLVMDLIDQVEDTGLAIAPDVADDDGIQILQVLIQTRTLSLRTERLAQETARRQLVHDQKFEAVDERMDTILSIVDHGTKYVFATVWLGDRGVRFPKEGNASSCVGKEIKALASKIGYDADSRPKEPLGNFPVHRYPVAIMERVGRKWIIDNQEKSDRANWFKKKHDLELLRREAYLLSEVWQATRLKTLKAAGYRCQVCNSEKDPAVHHRTYERLGHELPEDLVVLCTGCHKIFHANGKLARP